MKQGGPDRMQRIAALVQNVLAELVQQEMQHTSFKLVTITGISISKDLSIAKVFVSTLLEENNKEVVAVLNEMAKLLRRALAGRVKLRIVPELRFFYDDSSSRGYHISSLIDKALEKKTD